MNEILGLLEKITSDDITMLESNVKKSHGKIICYRTGVTIRNKIKNDTLELEKLNVSKNEINTDIEKYKNYLKLFDPNNPDSIVSKLLKDISNNLSDDNIIFYLEHYEQRKNQNLN